MSLVILDTLLVRQYSTPDSTFLTIVHQMPQPEASTCNVKLKIPELPKIKIVRS